jgi:hypothetical protein
MQLSQDFEASVASASITPEGGALVTFLTEKGRCGVDAAGRPCQQAKSELQRSPKRPGEH